LTGSRAAYPEEDVLGGVEARGVDLGAVGRIPLADDAAGEAGDGALGRLAVGVGVAPGQRVRHHEVDGSLCGAADLRTETMALYETSFQSETMMTSLLSVFFSFFFEWRVSGVFNQSNLFAALLILISVSNFLSCGFLIADRKFYRAAKNPDAEMCGGQKTQNKTR